MTPNVKYRISGWIRHVIYDRSEKLIAYCLRLPLLPFETTKLSHWTKNDLGICDLTDTQVMLFWWFWWNCWSSVTTRMWEQGNSLCIALHSFHFCIDRKESLRYIAFVEMKFLFFTTCHLNLNREISMKVLFARCSKLLRKTLLFHCSTKHF